MGGGNVPVPSQPRPSALPCSQPALTPLPFPSLNPLLSQPQMQPPTAGCGRCSIFQRTKRPLVPELRVQLRTSVSLLSLLSLHIPPSLLSSAVGFLAIPTHSSKITNPRISLPLAEVCGSLEEGKGSPNPRKDEQRPSCSLCRTCLPKSLQWTNESSEQHLPIGILLLPLLQSSFIYPRTPRLLLNPGIRAGQSLMG